MIQYGRPNSISRFGQRHPPPHTTHRKWPTEPRRGSWSKRAVAALQPGEANTDATLTGLLTRLAQVWCIVLRRPCVFSHRDASYVCLHPQQQCHSDSHRSGAILATGLLHLTLPRSWEGFSLALMRSWAVFCSARHVTFYSFGLNTFCYRTITQHLN